MKKLALLLFSGLFTVGVMAQELPQPSPMGKVEQKVGLTDITIEYSRPGVKGRTIFGDLVPYDKVWRLGANACTKLTSSTDFDMGGTTVKAGTYALFATPAASGEWTVVLNSNTEQWGAYDYDAEKNVATVKVKAQPAAFTETLTLGINNIGNSGAAITMAWDKVKIEVPFRVNTDKIVMANIDAAVKKGEDLEKVHYRAASYAFKSLKDNKKAMMYLKKSYSVKKTHFAVFLEAQIQKAEGNTTEAIKTAEEALGLAKAAEKKGWADYIEENITEWKK